MKIYKNNEYDFIYFESSNKLWSIISPTSKSKIALKWGSLLKNAKIVLLILMLIGLDSTFLLTTKTRGKWLFACKHSRYPVYLQMGMCDIVKESVCVTICLERYYVQSLGQTNKHTCTHKHVDIQYNVISAHFWIKCSA